MQLSREKRIKGCQVAEGFPEPPCLQGPLTTIKPKLILFTASLHRSKLLYTDTKQQEFPLH